MSDPQKRKRDKRSAPAASRAGVEGRGKLVDRSTKPARAYVVVPDLRFGDNRPTRTPQQRLEEAVGLAAAIELDIVGSGIAPVHKARASTLIGEGKVQELGAIFAAESVELVIVDGTLSPVQQRNLERDWKVKVLDRTGLILEIFGERARTSEGRLQVELAHLNYQKSRLVRSWTHLERQRGGVGFLGGPGETQIEADRRQIQERISRIEAQLAGVRKTRELHRRSRRRIPYPIAALVGYTNAGKSTLFNTLTKSAVFAEDLLFATLDPTLRRLKLPAGRTVILSDTVGFISDLPTHLIAAFRATLEEVIEADVILHVRDISHEDSDAQGRDVEMVLKQLNVSKDVEQGAQRHRFIEVWNKIDCLDDADRNALMSQAQRRDDVVAMSALNGEGIDLLLERIEASLTQRDDVFTVKLGEGAGADENWLRKNFEVLERRVDDGGHIALDVRVPPERLNQFQNRYKGRIADTQHSFSFFEMDG